MSQSYRVPPNLRGHIQKIYRGYVQGMLLYDLVAPDLGPDYRWPYITRTVAYHRERGAWYFLDGASAQFNRIRGALKIELDNAPLFEHPPLP